MAIIEDREERALVRCRQAGNTIGMNAIVSLSANDGAEEFFVAFEKRSGIFLRSAEFAGSGEGDESDCPGDAGSDSDRAYPGTAQSREGGFQ